MSHSTSSPSERPIVNSRAATLFSLLIVFLTIALANFISVMGNNKHHETVHTEAAKEAPAAMHETPVTQQATPTTATDNNDTDQATATEADTTTH